MSFRSRCNTAIARRDQEAASTQRVPTGSAEGIGVIGVPIDIVQGQCGILLPLDVHTNPVTVIEEESRADAERLVEGIVVDS